MFFNHEETVGAPCVGGVAAVLRRYLTLNHPPMSLSYDVGTMEDRVDELIESKQALAENIGASEGIKDSSIMVPLSQVLFGNRRALNINLLAPNHRQQSRRLFLTATE